ncbi:MAG: type IV pilus modification PilV family protein [Phycisphaeraceae bacterium]
MSRRAAQPGRRGFTLVEVAVSMLVVALLLTAALHTLAASRAGQRDTADRQRGFLLAEDLMSEILAQPYADAAHPGHLGPEAGETSEAGRSGFDDVDDYAGWVRSGPVARSGEALAGYGDWTRRASVTRVTPAGDSSQMETGVKRIEVVVHRGSRECARLVALRSRSWPAADEPGEAIAP